MTDEIILIPEVHHTDIFGQRLMVGDAVVYAALWDRSATLKVGKVTSLKRRAASYKNEHGLTVGVISLDRSFKGEWAIQNNGKELTLGFLDRLIKTDYVILPDDVRKLLGFTDV